MLSCHNNRPIFPEVLMPNHPFSLSMPPTLKLLYIKRTRRKRVEISRIKLHPSSDPWLYSLSTLVMGTHVISYDKWSISYIPNIWNSEICRYASASWEFQAVKNNESLLCPPKSFKGRQPLKLKVTTKKIKRKPFRIFQESLLLASSHLSPTTDLCQWVEQAQLLETEMSGIKKKKVV